MTDTRSLTDDPRLTAYALGELDAGESAAIEALLQATPALRETVSEIRVVAAALERALASEVDVVIEPGLVVAPVPSQDLTRAAILPGRDPELLDGGEHWRPRRQWARLLAFPQLYYLVGGLGAAGLAVIVALQRDDINAREEARAHALRVALERRAEARAGQSVIVQLPLVARDETPVGTAAELERRGAAAPAGRSPTYTGENAFLDARQHPSSTFPVNVAPASYAHVKRFILEGRRPPADAVRVEELINWFSYQYPAPAAAAGTEPVAMSLEVAGAPWAPGHRLARIGLKGRETAPADRPAASLVFLFDVSGSSAAPDRLPLMKESVRLLLRRLRADDRIALVTTAGDSGPALISTPVARLSEIHAALDSFTPQGSASVTQGVQRAYALALAQFAAAGVNRVVLCTDGTLNVGATSTSELGRLLEEKTRSGISLTVLGFGPGSANDATLELLADKSNGFCGYIDTARAAQQVVDRTVVGALDIIAQGVQVQVEFNPARVARYRLIGNENRDLTQRLLPDDRMGAGEISAGQAVTALYEVVPVAAIREATAGKRAGAPQVSAEIADELLTVKLRYTDRTGGVSRKLEVPLVDGGGEFAKASADFRFAAAVAGFGMILQSSPNRGTATLQDVLTWPADATDGSVVDPDGQRSEFLDLVRKAQLLME